MHKLLVDTATAEYFFCLDFFEDESVFRELFAPIVAVIETDLANALQVGAGRLVSWLSAFWHAFHAPLIGPCEAFLSAIFAAWQDHWDLVGVLLMLRVNAEHRRLVAKTRVPALEEYLDRVNALLWPRFKVGWGGLVCLSPEWMVCC